nr:immunoglobulin heavy chain junction region [Macaca mulatta]
CARFTFHGFAYGRGAYFDLW